MIGPLFHGTCLALAVSAAVAGCVWVYRRSPLLAAIVVAGLAVRLGAGIGLFSISFFQWPILATLQRGGGFWALAPDATVYYGIAESAARHATSVSRSSPSPAYLIALCLWLRATGLSPLTAVLFNPICYLMTTVALVAAAGRLSPRILAIVLFSFAFSPALILTNSQVLKDSFFVFVVVMACLAVVATLRCAQGRLVAHPYVLLSSVGLAAAGVAAVSGIRAYYALFIWGALAIALPVACALRRAGRLSFLVFGLSVLAILWGAFAIGAGPYYGYYARVVSRSLGARTEPPGASPDATAASHAAPRGPAELADALDAARAGFVRSGGNTNLVRSQPAGAGGWVRDLGAGVLTIFVPISALQAASIVSIHGGQGLLAITDLDTVFLDGTLLLIGLVIWRARPATRSDIPALMFLLVLFVVSTAAIAYVVTNFGTLFRLRLMIAAPAWLCPLAIGGEVGAVKPCSRA